MYVFLFLIICGGSIPLFVWGLVDVFEGEKNHKKGGLNCVFGNFFLSVLDNCPQVQSLKKFRV